METFPIEIGDVYEWEGLLYRIVGTPFYNSYEEGYFVCCEWMDGSTSKFDTSIGLIGKDRKVTEEESMRYQLEL